MSQELEMFHILHTYFFKKGKIIWKFLFLVIFVFSRLTFFFLTGPEILRDPIAHEVLPVIGPKY